MGCKFYSNRRYNAYSIEYIFRKKFNVKLLNNYVILYYSIVYTTHHMINYHYLDVDTHNRHHADENTNFGPDYWMY